MAYKLAVVAFVVLLMVLSTSATLCDTTMPDDVFQINSDAAVDSYVETYDVEGNSNEITLSQDDNEYLHLNTETREILVKKELHEGLVINLVLFCKPNSGTQELHILTFMVIASNKPPEFSETTYSFSVREDAEVGSTVDNSIVATDNEGDDIYYRIVDAENSDFFQLKSNRDPTIILAKPIDYETVKTVSFFILAEQNDQTSGALGMSAKVDIHIINVDDMSPVFLYRNYSARLADDFEVGSTIEIRPPLLAEDQDDMNTHVMYSITAGEGFSINEDTGEITVDTVPKEGYFPLIVQAWQKDDPSKTDWTLVKIYVAASSITELKFEQNIYIATLSETTPVGVTFLTVKGKYSGSASILWYDILGPSAVHQFEMTGESILLKSNLDYETSTQHDFHIIVTNGVTTATARVFITVKDVNDNTPEILNERNVNVQINAMTDRENVHTVEASDADLNNVITFHLESGPASFDIGLNSGVISYTAAENSAAHDEVYLLIKVKDDGDPYRETYVGVTVQLLRQPEFERSTYNVKISEAEPVDALVLTVSAKDDPFGESLQYGMWEDMPNFRINKQSGEIFLSHSLDYEATPYHIIHVTATDNVSIAAAIVIVEVIDVNDNNPDISSETNVVKTVKGEKDEVVYQIQAADEDSNTELSYHMSVGAPLFAVNSTGLVTIAADAEDLTEDRYFILVKIRDNGQAYRESTVSITVDLTGGRVVPPCSTQAVAQAGGRATLIIIILGVAAGILL